MKYKCNIQNFSATIMILLTCMFWPFDATAQDTSKITETGGILIKMSYGGHLPAGDLKNRFGANFSPGLHVEYLFPQSSYSIGVEGTYQFGREVKKDVLAPLRNDEGYVLNDVGSYADVVLRQRGLYFGLYGSKFWVFHSDAAWSGIKLTLGAGILQHKIRVQNNSRDVQFLVGEGEQGYDRLTNGLASHLAIGYQHLSKDHRVNYYIGLEIIAGSTQNRRSWNYDINSALDESRFDMHYGLRAAWILPFYTSTNPELIYY